MKKRWWLLAVSFILAAGLLCACSGGSGEEKPSLKIGTAGSGGTYYSYANQLAELTKDDFSFTVKTTAGSAANIRLIQNGFIDLAIVQSDLLYSAEMGTGMFEGDKKIGDNRSYSTVTGLYTEALQIVVNADSDIFSVSDLRGKSVSVGEEESGVLQNAGQILQAYGMNIKDIDAHYLSFSASADAMRNGQIDAFFCMAGAPTNAVAELANDFPIRLLSLDSEEQEKLLNLYEVYVPCMIPDGTYKDQDEDVQTLGVRAVLIASNALDKEMVRLLTEDVIRYSQKLNANVRTDDIIDGQVAIDSIPIGFHPGAAEYLNSLGVNVEAYQGIGTNGVFASQDD